MSDSRKAITSCFVTFSILAMRFTSIVAFFQYGPRYARDLSGSFERRAGGQLDCEPDLVLAFQFPDGFHPGTGYSGQSSLLR